MLLGDHASPRFPLFFLKIKSLQIDLIIDFNGMSTNFELFYA